jgi:hypothetical protein
MRVNYFLSIIGELLQRMDDPVARYSIALPNIEQFRNLCARLPELAKQRTTIDAIFVSEDGKIDIVKQVTLCHTRRMKSILTAIWLEALVKYLPLITAG